MKTKIKYLLRRLRRRLFKSNWTKWQDIAVFNYGNSSYLLQGKRSIRSNRKKFRRVSMGTTYKIMSLEDLKGKGPFSRD